jgi:splicing factor U2AF subunit
VQFFIGIVLPSYGFHLQVFLEYFDTVACANARNALNGRKFGGNVVSAVYYPEDKYYSREYGA